MHYVCSNPACRRLSLSRQDGYHIVLAKMYPPDGRPPITVGERCGRWVPVADVRSVRVPPAAAIALAQPEQAKGD